MPNDLGFHERPPCSSLLLVENATRPCRTRQSRVENRRPRKGRPAVPGLTSYPIGRITYLLAWVCDWSVTCPASGQVALGGSTALGEAAPATGARLSVRRPCVRRAQLEGRCERGRVLAAQALLPDRLDARAVPAPAVGARLDLVRRLPRRVPVQRLRRSTRRYWTGGRSRRCRGSVRGSACCCCRSASPADTCTAA